MAKLKLEAAPTFQAEVGIPVAGSDPVPVSMTFKHRTKAQLDEFIKSRTDSTDADSFMAMVEGWELDDEFNRANVEKLLQNYMGAALATFYVYVDQLVQAKAKN